VLFHDIALHDMHINSRRNLESEGVRERKIDMCFRESVCGGDAQQLREDAGV